MDETSFKILETLSREVGRETSISQLTERVGELYGSAYYANIYKKLRQLEKDKIIRLDKVGNTTIVSLNFRDYWIADVLAQVEIMKKQRFLQEHIELQKLFHNIETTYDWLWEDYREKFEDSDRAPPFIRSISAIRPDKNAMLNRLELLVLLRGPGADRIQAAAARLPIQALQGPMKIDALVLTETEFLEMLSSGEANPAKEMLHDKIAFFGPQNFWHAVRSAAEKGTALRAEQEETVPARISERDLVYNMARFGYKEMGSKITAGRDICLEYVIAGMIAQGDARRMEAVPVLLSKNRTNYDTLIFLSQKFRFSERLLGLLEVLAEVAPKEHERRKLQSVAKELGEMKIKPAPVDKESIIEKLRLYNAA